MVMVIAVFMDMVMTVFINMDMTVFMVHPQKTRKKNAMVMTMMIIIIIWN